MLRIHRADLRQRLTLAYLVQVSLHAKMWEYYGPFQASPRFRWNCCLLGYYTASSGKTYNYLVCNNTEGRSSQYRGISKCLGTTLTDQNGIHTETRAAWTRGMRAAVRARIFRLTACCPKIQRLKNAEI